MNTRRNCDAACHCPIRYAPTSDAHVSFANSAAVGSTLCNTYYCNTLTPGGHGGGGGTGATTAAATDADNSGNRGGGDKAS